MQQNNNLRVAYVVKRYPRFSETFIVNEILAHEKAGLSVDIYSIKTSVDTHFQNIISEVKADVNYLNNNNRIKAEDLLAIQFEVNELYPGFLKNIGDYRLYSCEEMYSGMKLAQYIKQNVNNHIHAHFATSASAVARIASSITSVPYTLTAHAKDIYHEDNLQEDLEQKIVDAEQIITVSNFNKEYLDQQFPYSSDKITRIYNGLNLKQFRYKKPENRKPVIISVGRLVEKKGFEDLISACEILSRKKIDYKCLIVGEGELEDKLHQMVDNLGLQNTVELAGPMPQNKIKKLIQSAAMFAAPCVIGEDGNRDGLPTVLLESMALGTPCISTDVTGIPEVVVHGKTGLLAEQNNPDSLAKAIVKLLHNKDLGIQISIRARKLIEDNFDIDKNTVKIRDVFSKCMGAKNLILNKIAEGVKWK